ncbi:tautomerase family protein [Leptothoe sp. PORK10 BA2]|uniref:tautomerase family protein n=1 Tax=Leptothoe sp. PORK10 BA2 TaxID=3110254 RepID=UPI002B20A1CC|nr:hypothetical protein [Leptothoe sp. PORK10 BA2]MEA5464740.1 hypothetical protein [Leptothoe sp. PORK10 BA2]
MQRLMAHPSVTEHSVQFHLFIYQESKSCRQIKLTLPQHAWTKDEKAKIIERFTNALNKVAQESGKGDIKKFISVQIEETAEGGYAIGEQIFG